MSWGLTIDYDFDLCRIEVDGWSRLATGEVIRDMGAEAFMVALMGLPNPLVLLFPYGGAEVLAETMHAAYVSRQYDNGVPIPLARLHRRIT